MYKKITLMFAVLLASLGMSTYAAVGDVFTSGNYRYKVIAEGDANEVELVSPSSGSYNINSTSAFSSIDVVTYNDVNYTIVGIGEYAFQNAQFPTNGNTNMPPHVRYVSDYAFKGVKSGSSTQRGSIRFYGNALRYLSSKAFLDNNMQGSILITSGDAENGFVQVAVGSYSTTTLYLAAERGKKIIAFPKSFPVGTSSNWTVLKNIDLSGSTITSIGAYAMMNCTNYTQIDLGNVEKIDTAAFKNTKLSSLTLPATINSIAADAFEGVTTIASMTINCNLTPEMADVVFDDAIYTALKEKVNFGSDVDVAAYKANPNWGRFFDAPQQDVYILGEVNGNGWATNVGVPMATQDNITYTATVTTTGSNNGYSYFGFTNTLAEGANDWDAIAASRFGAVADGDNFLVTKEQLEKDLSLTRENYKAFQIPAGTWKLTVNINSMTLRIEKIMPNVWVMGTVNGNTWAANVGVKMDWDNTDKKYTKRIEITDEYGYFSFTTALGENADDWNGIAAARFGAVSNGDFEVTPEMVHNGQALSLSALGSSNAFKIPAGTFTLTINDLDEDTRNLVITGNFADEVDTIPFNVGKFKYRRLNNDNEVEMLGYNEDYPNEALLKANFTGLSAVTYEGVSYKIVSIGEEAFVDRGLGGSFTLEPMSYLREIKKGAFRNAGLPAGGTALARPITLPNSLQIIGDEAFANSEMSVLTIPANVNSIGNGIVAGVRRLQSISVASGNTGYKAINGDIYTYDGKTLVAAAPQKTTLTVAEGCETIAPEAVMNIPGITSDEGGDITGAVIMRTIVLPSTLTTIGENAFTGSKSFTSVTCNAINPPTGGVFDDAVYQACANQLVVPEGSEAAYRADENWGKFYPPVYTVSIAEDIEHGTVEADKAEAEEGETVTLTVAPAEGYELQSLTYAVEGADPVTIENNAFNMPAANVTINATFKAIDYTITIADMQNGAVTAPETAHFGETVTLTVTPAEGYELQSLTYTVEGADPVTIENNAFVMPAANVTINATFAAINYTITVADGIENGTVTAPATATIGETVALTVTPAEGYQLKSITVAPETLNLAVEVNENYEFTMPADNVTVTAEFEEIPPVESVITFEAAPENGNVAVYVGEVGIESGATVAEGTEVMVVLTPAEGYEVSTFAIATAEPEVPADLPRRAPVPFNQGENNTYTFEMPAEPVTITAEFAETVVTAISDLRAAGDGNVRYIDVNGRVSDKPFQGINIVVDANGNVTKVVK